MVIKLQTNHHHFCCTLYINRFVIIALIRSKYVCSLFMLLVYFIFVTNISSYNFRFVFQL